jgi:endonuclease-3
MNDRDIVRVMDILQRELARGNPPVITRFARKKMDPFRILIATVLSSRTTDEVTEEASQRLFSLASGPEEMLRLSDKEIARAIYPVGFYRTKARYVKEISRGLLEKFQGEVPRNMRDLLSLKGVGRKTANLVLTMALGGEGICVDTHVHRISNRLGYIRTKNPAATEQALRAKLPRRYWTIYNAVMVAHGKRTCRPISPWCSRCPVFRFCGRVGVTSSR